MSLYEKDELDKQTQDGYPWGMRRAQTTTANIVDGEATFTFTNIMLNTSKVYTINLNVTYGVTQVVHDSFGQSPPTNSPIGGVNGNWTTLKHTTTIRRE